MVPRASLRRLARVVRLVAVAFLVSSLSVGCRDSSPSRGMKRVSFVAPDGSERARFLLEIADTEPLRQKGLMFRESLPADGGMLFIFEELAPRTFWMKNTKLSLDMIFVGSDRSVQGILASVPPMNEEPRSVPGVTSQYVIELAAGVAAGKGIRVGDVVRW